ncbi:MAG: division/cell wall cluster transcriptional repressor MraZ [Lachnospiraceae bacterium]|nr:division/cell wall cluster transcriptional repressor MraZ [Lachnospiraceae bacterium]MBR0152405.1 division/cell wall cluster transcriptional repressor MraZ [Lachnospiraceae bacterium]
MSIGFMGRFNHSVDAKGRVILPAKFREKLGDEFVMTVGLDGCLFVYPNEQWEVFAEQLSNLPGTAEGREFQRYFYENAVSCEIDKQGRVLIPADLRAAAGLTKDIVFIGMNKRIEIWSKDRKAESSTLTPQDINQVADRMAEYGIRF